MTANLYESGLGLDEKMLEALRSSASLVVHNTGRLNFVLPLQSFRSRLEGMLNLIDIVTTASKLPHVLFLSSLSSVIFKSRDSMSIAAQVIYTHSTTGPSGYTETKYVQSFSLTTLHRICQLQHLSLTLVRWLKHKSLGIMGYGRMGLKLNLELPARRNFSIIHWVQLLAELTGSRWMFLLVCPSQYSPE